MHNKIRCNECGKFISVKDLENGTAKHELLEPDSHFGPEVYESICKDCLRKDRFVDLLWEYVRGLDCAGSFESENFEDMYNGLKYGNQSVDDILLQIKDRYQSNNPEIVKEFENL